MENKFLIGIDLDGTLLNKKSRLSFSTISYLKKISKQGHIIVLCTGRPLRAMLPYYKILKLNTPVICYNGGRVFNPNDKNFPSITYSFNKEDIKDIINTIGLDKIDNIMCEVDDKAWVYNHDEKIEEILWHNNISLIYGDLNNTLNVLSIASFVLSDALIITATLFAVGSKSNPSKVAGAIANIFRENKSATIQTVGAASLNQAIKAIAIARGFVAPMGDNLVTIPAFSDIEIDGEKKTAIKLIIESK